MAHSFCVLILCPHLVAQVVALEHLTPVVDLWVRVGEQVLHHGHLPSPPASGHSCTLVKHLGLPLGSVIGPPNSTGSWSGLMNLGSSCFQLPPRITIFLRVSSLMNSWTKLKATGNSLGAQTHETPWRSWTREDLDTQSQLPGMGWTEVG